LIAEDVSENFIVQSTKDKATAGEIKTDVTGDSKPLFYFYVSNYV
jgi:hypothetical protein